MWYLTGIPDASGKLLWQFQDTSALDKEDGLTLSFILMSFLRQLQRREAIKHIRKILEKNDIAWIVPAEKEWTLDLDRLAEFVLKERGADLSSMNWFRGKAFIEPEFETKQDDFGGQTRYEATLAFYIVPEALRMPVMPLEPPIGIRESLEHFRKDHPEPDKVAFILMEFGKTSTHTEIVKAIQSMLHSHGIAGVRADDKQYHDDLFDNVLTYMYGCGFGIAVFERLEEDAFNPNVSLEVGYMLALQKPVCLLKDRTLRTLPTDLVGKLYREFNPQDPTNTIPEQLTRWLSDKGIVR